MRYIFIAIVMVFSFGSIAQSEGNVDATQFMQDYEKFVNDYVALRKVVQKAQLEGSSTDQYRKEYNSLQVRHTKMSQRREALMRKYGGLNKAFTPTQIWNYNDLSSKL